MVKANKLIIGVSDCSKFANYSKWIGACPQVTEVVRLDYENGSIRDLERCHGLVLTGGEDLHPRFYGMPEYYEFCYKTDVNENRDEFEWKLLELCQRKELPLLGICRGLQIGNAFFGGTLIPDIPRWGKFNHSKLEDGRDRHHAIQVDPNSWFFRMVQSDHGTVNSNHHQSADRIGADLVASAFSPDGVVEAMERKEPSGKPFLCLVQWHPERMDDQDGNFVQNIRSSFIAASHDRSA
jgi:putative glutamine amidotransferase